MPKGPNTERNAQIVADRMSGMTLQACGDKHGICRERVREIVAKHERRKIEGTEHLFPDDRAKLARWRYVSESEGKSLKQLAATTDKELNKLPNVGPKYVAWLRKHGELYV
jgi:hypothetical protein